jgi:hypothetical protein
VVGSGILATRRVTTGRVAAEVLPRNPWKAETGLPVQKSRQICGEIRAGAIGGARAGSPRQVSLHGGAGSRIPCAEMPRAPRCTDRGRMRFGSEAVSEGLAPTDVRNYARRIWWNRVGGKAGCSSAVPAS